MIDKQNLKCNIILHLHNIVYLFTQSVLFRTTNSFFKREIYFFKHVIFFFFFFIHFSYIVAADKILVCQIKINIPCYNNKTRFMYTHTYIHTFRQIIIQWQLIKFLYTKSSSLVTITRHIYVYTHT